MKHTLMAVLAVSMTLSAPSAFSDTHSPIAQRQAAMKTISEQMKVLGGMARIGGVYDDFFAQSAFEIMRDAALSAQQNFPPQGQTGETTRAKPAIWAADSDFGARMGKFVADLDAAVAAAPADQAGFVPLFAAVSQNCKACHEHYRAPKS